jgi:putative oxidoreductase
MPVVFVIGRVVFVLYFIFAGLQRLMNIAASADFFSHKFAVPSALIGLAGQIENIVGLSTPQILSVLGGAIELAAGLLIAFNVGTRAMACVLIIMTALAIYYGNDFWHMSGGERDGNLIQAILQISLIGALLVFVSLGSARPIELDRRTDV